MNTLRRLTARLRNLLTRQTDQERFLEEMDEHISRQTEENLRSGMSPTEARRHALLKFGAVEAIREQYHSEKILPLIESVVSDIRYSVRILRKNAGFTAIAAASLALAIGANTTIFSITKRVPFRPAQCASSRAASPAPLAWRQANGGFKRVGHY